MNRNLSNALYGVLDYASYPLGMLIVAPVVLHHMGEGEYGLWMVTTSIVSGGGIIASGFSDAALRRVAELRGRQQPAQTEDAVRALFTVNLLLSILLAACVWVAAPWLGTHLAASRSGSLQACVVCLRIASFIILLRGLETVSASTQRAFEDYRGTVQVSTAVRLLTLAIAALLASFGMRTESILMATGLLFAVGTGVQFMLLRRFVDIERIWRPTGSKETRLLLGSGVFVWLQAVGAVVFRQCDRIFLGVALGARAVAPYSFSIQIAEPLFGLTASGLSFFFPYLSGRAGALSSASLRQVVFRAFLVNLLLVVVGAILLLVLGTRFLQLWLGSATARETATLLPSIVIGTALSGLSVTGTYAMQALGLFRTVACISLGTRALLLLSMLYGLHAGGVHGLAIARVYFGATSLLVYLPLLYTLFTRVDVQNPLVTTSLPAVIQEGVSL